MSNTGGNHDLSMMKTNNSEFVLCNLIRYDGYNRKARERERGKKRSFSFFLLLLCFYSGL
jgi:hypothetical protein